MKAENLMTLGEVALMLRLSNQTIYKLLKEEAIPAVKIGSQWRFDREQIREWISNGGSIQSSDAANALKASVA